MKILEEIAGFWRALCEQVGPVWHKIAGFFGKAGKLMGLVWEQIVKLRKIFLSIPVVLVALDLAQRNMTRLPDVVGLNLQTDGTFAIHITRELACWGPVLLTLVCLVLMFCSRRVLTPWVVSLITLLLPIFIWVINVFPA